jgi:hypothetical protein
MSVNLNISSNLEQRWHDPAFVLDWKVRRGSRDRKKSVSDLIVDFPLLSGIAHSAYAPRDARVRALAVAEYAEQIGLRDGESLVDRARRLDGKPCLGGQGKSARAAFRPPELIVRVRDEWSIMPLARKASPEKLAKAKALYDLGLTAKAQRELACGLLVGEVRCKNGHRFWTHYRCGHRYCLDCGSHTALRLFAKHLPRVQAVADALSAKGRECVIAKIDFTRRKPCGHRGKCNCPMPNADYNRELNVFIRRLCRALERKFGITRDDYGMAVHDEIGGGNVNAHAHALYVGPYIPQRWLSETWKKICGDGSFIVSIKRANSVAAALWHATKYPGKFIRESTPERLAELELSYHRVRRFRLLGAFDKRVAERVITSVEQDEPGATADLLDQVLRGSHIAGQRCPCCGAALHRVPGWRDLDSVIAEGLLSLDAARQEATRKDGLSGAGAGPPNGR